LAGSARCARVEVSASDDYTGQVLVDSLEPTTTYRYLVWFSIRDPDRERGPVVR